MSGNFVQRGEPAIVDKWSRTKMALLEGADLVIELPTVFAVSSAPYFSFAAVNILNSTGIVDYLCFASEDGEITPLYDLAILLEKEPVQLSNLIKENLKAGKSYPKARSDALIAYYQQIKDNQKDYIGFLTKPNNLLGINYIRALIKLNSSIKPLTIPRIGSGYYETELKGNIASATGIRKNIQTNGPQSYLEKSIPSSCLTILLEQFRTGKGPVWLNNFSQLILGLLRRSTEEELALLPDVSEGFERRLKETADKCINLEELISELKTKRYTWTRIQRTLIHLLLSIDKKYYQLDYLPYLRVLGFNSTGRLLLKKIKNKAETPIIMSVAEQIKIWQKQKHQPIYKNSLAILQKDILATDLYQLACPEEKHRKAGADFYHKVIIV
jgi:predicted nucleotidyltransferase